MELVFVASHTSFLRGCCFPQALLKPCTVTEMELVFVASHTSFLRGCCFPQALLKPCTVTEHPSLEVLMAGAVYHDTEVHLCL
jgi:hypothetical protein